MNRSEYKNFAVGFGLGIPLMAAFAVVEYQAGSPIFAAICAVFAVLNSICFGSAFTVWYFWPTWAGRD